MPAADFTFDISTEPPLTVLVPIYGRLLGQDTSTPTVSLGAVPRADAVTWLRAQHARYVAAMGKRSALIAKMALEDHVELQDVVD